MKCLVMLLDCEFELSMLGYVVRLWIWIIDDLDLDACAHIIISM